MPWPAWLQLPRATGSWAGKLHRLPRRVSGHAAQCDPFQPSPGVFTQAARRLQLILAPLLPLLAGGSRQNQLDNMLRGSVEAAEMTDNIPDRALQGWQSADAQDTALSGRGLLVDSRRPQKQIMHVRLPKSGTMPCEVRSGIHPVSGCAVRNVQCKETELGGAYAFKLFSIFRSSEACPSSSPWAQQTCEDAVGSAVLHLARANMLV